MRQRRARAGRPAVQQVFKEWEAKHGNLHLGRPLALLGRQNSYLLFLEVTAIIRHLSRGIRDVHVLKDGSESRLQSRPWRPTTTYQSTIISKLGFETEILGLEINYSSVLSEIKICNGLTFYALCFHKLKTARYHWYCFCLEL